MKIQMKPETIERRSREGRAKEVVRKAVLVARLERKMLEEGTDSIWAELLAEARAAA